MTVQRFTPVASAAISLSEQGEYVKYEDYERLAAKLSMINGLMEAAEQANTLAHEATEKLVRERDALAAENAGLKSKAAELVHEASEVYSAYNATITEPDGDFMDMQTLQEMQCVETPSTEAFLAEVRASARNDFIDRIEWIIRNECNPEKTETILNELQSFSETVSQEAAQRARKQDGPDRLTPANIIIFQRMKPPVSAVAGCISGMTVNQTLSKALTTVLHVAGN